MTEQCRTRTRRDRQPRPISGATDGPHRRAPRILNARPAMWTGLTPQHFWWASWCKLPRCRGQRCN